MVAKLEAIPLLLMAAEKAVTIGCSVLCCSIVCCCINCCVDYSCCASIICSSCCACNCASNSTCTNCACIVCCYSICCYIAYPGFSCSICLSNHSFNFQSIHPRPLHLPKQSLIQLPKYSAPIQLPKQSTLLQALPHLHLQAADTALALISDYGSH